MLGLNEFWRQEAPNLRPTAGYYTDAQRYLRDIDSQIKRRGLAADRFVRLAVKSPPACLAA